MPEFDDLGSLDDLGDLDGISFDDDPARKPRAAEPAAPATAAVSALGAVIQDLLSRRNYQQVLQIAASQRDAVERDPQVAAMVRSAKGHLEQEAFLNNFLDAARKALAAGQLDQARQFAEKARALDPSHPDVAGMLAHLARAIAPAPTPAPADDLLSFDEAFAPGPVAPTAPRAPAPSPAAAPVFAIDALSFDEPAPPARPAPEPFRPAPSQPQVFQPQAPTAAETSFGDLAFDATPGNEPSFGTTPSFGGGAPASFGFDPGPARTPGTEASFAAPPPSYQPPSPTPAPANFGFGGGGEEGGDRIQELLADGQKLFDREEYQGAIDIWSRIFLIDIENQEASRRIEAARGRKAERERQAEELFAQASAAIEQKSFDEAKAMLGQALALNAGHAYAREYLDQLEAGKVPLIRRQDETSLDLLDDGGLGDLQKAAGVRQTGQTLEAAVARDRIVVVKKVDRKLIAAAALGAIVLLGGLGYVFTNWDKIFPKEKPETFEQSKKTGGLERAKKVFDSGKIENAIALLEKMTPDEDGYKEGQTLLTQWKAMVKTGTGEDTGPSAEQVSRSARLLEAGREAYRQRQYLRARRYLDRASKVQPLDAADQVMKDDIELKLLPLAAEVSAFASGEYEAVLPTLWRKRDADPKNVDITQMIVDSYYNLAVSDLQKSLPDQAAQKLQEALNLSPGNDELTRLRLFATSYSSKSLDLRYRIFVKYLPMRS
jgi:tetratricopeptide (TPR) repeat protein